MPTPRTSTYAVDSGGGVYAGMAAALPAWLSGQPLSQVFAISGTTLAGSAGAPTDDPADPFTPINRAVIAYSGMALAGTQIVVAASGGHGDSADNGVRSIDLGADSPSWSLRMAPSGTVATDVAYYPDGKPSSRHTYWSAQYAPSTSRGARVMLHSSRFVYGGAVTFSDSNGFNLGSNSWDADNTWADAPSALPVCADTAGNVFAIDTAGHLYKWTMATDTWALIGTFNSTLPFRPPMAYDSLRNQLFSMAWGDGQASGSGLAAYKVAADGSTRDAITFNASAAYTQWQADTGAYAGMDYVPELDKFIWYSGQGSAAQRIYLITPNAGTAWDIEQLTLAGGSATLPTIGGGGVCSRMRYVPSLKTAVFFSEAISPLYAVRLAL